MPIFRLDRRVPAPIAETDEKLFAARTGTGQALALLPIERTSVIGPLGAGEKGTLPSAATGHEKPSRKAFKIALNTGGHPRKAWMIGDNLNTDVEGAEAAGIPAVLVRHKQTGGHRYAATLHDVSDIIHSAAPLIREPRFTKPEHQRPSRDSRTTIGR